MIKRVVNAASGRRSPILFHRPRWWLPLLALSVLAGCGGEDAHTTYETIEDFAQSRLPLAPHVLTVKARPTPEMMTEWPGAVMGFRILDKRTLRVEHLRVAVGEEGLAPWEGWLKVVAYVPDLLVREGEAIHGPEGHVNPASWIQLRDDRGQLLHEGWVFYRDSAQTAWDDPRFDVTFLGRMSAAEGEPGVPPPAG